VAVVQHGQERRRNSAEKGAQRLDNNKKNGNSTKSMKLIFLLIGINYYFYFTFAAI
jgi:hypothetical protein